MINEEKDILSKSEQIPVLVDFWAPWCGPCKFLGPIVEELAREADGKWVLVKVNTDEQPELMHKYKVQGIPTLKLIHKRQILAEKVGALPKHELKKWLDDFLPSPEKEDWTQLQLKLSEVSSDFLYAEIEEFVKKYPTHKEARKLLLRVLSLRAPEKSEKLLQQWSDLKSDQEFVQDLQAISEFLTKPLNQNSKADHLLKAASKALKSGELEEALQQLIESLLYDKEAYQQLARRVCVALFHQLGENHELSKKYRRKFGMYLN
ncbi:thioredoxin [Schleiferia thermophila]|uniref:thioredoxin n=1 Tax=Schleiferia thermophila TaxID=884107 RepID=UPI003EEA903C